MKSDVYSCDWCYVEAPSRGSVGGDWKVFPQGSGDKVSVHHLYLDCSEAREAAIELARKERLAVSDRARTGQVLHRP